ncbi:hypothetical protein [Streptacidiphilus sp. P02-A3a]|uniref:hypothetical protein n=1 Tax=Streptacidiphilus sp. P02-A3a TaxID=2704468 RepID=UPI0015FB09A8|nr:hypothetical protein [Streptacidiphilus sp. P02-A3a]QMU72857.1 hypothetical protein GXP74_36055 [Streptacidiphilus sp. P02-A3a]
MTVEPGQVSAQAHAERMRAALAAARWDTTDDPAGVVAVLARIVEGVCGPVATVEDGRTVFGSQALGSAYVFCASVQKSISLEYARQHPDLRELSPEGHLALVRPVLPQFERQRLEALRLIDQEFPLPR